MAEFSNEEKVIAIGKETVRGDAPVALDVVVPCDRSSEFDYTPVYVEDDKTRGIKDRVAPAMVAKECSGSISGMPVEPLTVGYFLRSLMGTATPVLVGTTAYEHTFTRVAGLIVPTYTFVIDRQLSKKAYTRGVVKSMSLSVPFNDKALVDWDILCEKEAVSALAIPAITEPAPFTYDQVAIYLAAEGAAKPGSADLTIREFTLEIDNQSIMKRTYNASYDVKDIVTPEKYLISGSFNAYFETETERAAFLAGTSRALWIDMTGALIETTYYNALEITIPKIYYKAYPWGESEGMLAAAVAFDAYYRVASTSSISILLRNTDTAY